MQEVNALADEVRVLLGPTAGPVASNHIKALGAIALTEAKGGEAIKAVLMDANGMAFQTRNRLKSISREHPELDLTEIDAL